jgi:hypothetical protein
MQLVRWVRTCVVSMSRCVGTGSAAHVESRHPLSCPGADVYSYAGDEDDMVTDPDLDRHLRHWGINMLQVLGGVTGGGVTWGGLSKGGHRCSSHRVSIGSKPCASYFLFTPRWRRRRRRWRSCR